ncbi:methyltransferase domain-containing protein [bacterium]|nr:methyltransferase domain-containing protein [bacterium]
MRFRTASRPRMLLGLVLPFYNTACVLTRLPYFLCKLILFNRPWTRESRAVKTEQIARERFMRLANGFRASSVILTAVEMGFFHQLAHHPQDARELSANLGIVERGAVRVLRVLTAFGLVVYDGRLYRIHDDYLPLLSPEGEAYLGDICQHNYRLMKRWINLDETLRTGRPPKRGPRDSADLQSFILGMENISRRAAHDLKDGIGVPRPKTILDLGSGPGTYSSAYLQQYDDVHVTLLDRPEVNQIARVILEAYDDRITCIDGDMFEVDFGGPYDLIMLNNIIHSWGDDHNRELVTKTARSLTPGGRLAIKDFFTHTDRHGPEHATLFGINMFLANEHAGVYSYEDAIAWGDAAGLQFERRFMVDSTSGALVLRKGEI